jgi:signal transduction histidine kinase
MIATFVRNLVSNAIKYTRSGGKITVSTITETDKIIISVSDTGIGINAKDVEKLFNLINSQT